MQQAEEAAAKSEAQRHGIFRLVKKRRVVQLQFSERVAQRFVVVGEHRKQSGENHRLDGFKSGQRRSWTARIRDGIAHARIGHALDVGDDETDVAGFEFFERDGFRCERAELLDLVNFVAVDEANLHVIRDAPFHHAHQHDGAAVNVEPRIKNQRLQRVFRAALGRRHASNSRFENFFDAEAAFCADQQRVFGGNGEDTFDLFLCEIRLRGGQINFIDHRNNRKVVPRGEKSIRDGLRFDALRRVDNEERAFAGGEGARDFVGKIDVAGRID